MNQHPPEHQWMKNPHTHSIMDEPPTPTCHSINGWKSPKLTPLWMKIQHYRPGHQWMKKPQTDYIMDEPPASNHKSITSQKTPNWLHYGWTSSMDEPPSTYTRITAWKNLTELVHLWRNLQHPPTKAPIGVKTPNWPCQGWTSSTSPIRTSMDENIPNWSSFKFEPPSDHKRITRWRKSQTKLVPFWMNPQHQPTRASIDVRTPNPLHEGWTSI